MMRKMPLLLLLGASALGLGCGSKSPRPSVLLVTFDTTRADHIGAYGHPDVRTPTIDGLAAEGVLFENAAAPVPITLPSHSSLMTGKVPFAHGVRDNGIFSLGASQTTLAEILRDQGYRTAAAIGSFPLTKQFGIDQGFELFDDHVTADVEDFYGERIVPRDSVYFDERPAPRVNEALLPWLEEHHEEPFFVWAHYFDPHHPHQAPSPFRELLAHDPYAAEISFADEALGRLVGKLAEHGVLENTIVVVTSDHGEGNGEHNESTHSLLVYDSTLHVPLVMMGPGLEQGVRVSERVGTIDVMPTLLELLGVEVPGDVQGRSLLPLVGGKERPSAIYAETLSPRLMRNWGELRSIALDGLKYIHGPRPELFDLAADPKELRNLVDTRPDDTGRLRGVLEEYLERNAVEGVDASIEVDEETARRLQALGYLASAGGPIGAITEILRDDGDPPQDHAHTVSAYSAAKGLLVKGRALEARGFLEDLLRTDPGNPHYLELLVSVEMQLGRLEQALEVLDRLVSSPTGYPPPEKLLAMASTIYLRQGNVDAAYDRLRQSETLRETAPGQFRLAQISEAQGFESERERHLARAVELDPTFSPALVNWAIREAQAGELEAARRYFSDAIARQPYDARAIFNYGAFLANQGELEQALEYLRRAVVLQPSYPSARLALVEVGLQLGALEIVFEQEEELARLDPNGSHYRQTRALLEEYGL